MRPLSQKDLRFIAPLGAVDIRAASVLLSARGRELWKRACWAMTSLRSVSFRIVSFPTQAARHAHAHTHARAHAHAHTPQPNARAAEEQVQPRKSVRAGPRASRDAQKSARFARCRSYPPAPW
jgi:ABC-type nickel/cobalt efflux system permease component RcnA